MGGKAPWQKGGGVVTGLKNRSVREREVDEECSNCELLAL